MLSLVRIYANSKITEINELYQDNPQLIAEKINEIEIVLGNETKICDKDHLVIEEISKICKNKPLKLNRKRVKRYCNSCTIDMKTKFMDYYEVKQFSIKEASKKVGISSSSGSKIIKEYKRDGRLIDTNQRKTPFSYTMNQEHIEFIKGLLANKKFSYSIQRKNLELI